MRPPPEGGGYRFIYGENWVKFIASMRPPPEGGGYRAAGPECVHCPVCFNEAAT